MRRRVLLALLPWLLAPAARGAPGAEGDLPTLRRTIPLGAVRGRIDHMAIDRDGRRLVVAALGNDSVEVVDLSTGQVAHSIAGVAEPQGVAVLPDTGQIAVASGGEGTLRLYDGATFQPLETLTLGDDADNLRVEPGTGRLLVGFGDGRLATVAGGRVTSSTALAGHPEAFQPEAGGPRVFVNVPEAGHVAVLDRAAGRVLATWPLKDARANYPMAFDEPRQRLLVGCREPPRLLVLDTSPGSAGGGGRVVASVEISGDVDDVFVNAAGDRAYLSCGAGFLDVVARRDGDRYERVASVPTAPGARTSLLVPATGALYLALPRRPPHPAEIREYTVH